VTVAATGVTATAGAGGAKITGGAGADTITGGAGGDTLHGAGGNDVIVGGGGKDSIFGDAGVDKITISGSSVNLNFAAGDTGANTSTTIQTAELTSTFDVVTGAVAGDTITLVGLAGYGFGDVTVGNTNLAGVDDQIVFARGAYDAAAGTFTFAANGPDSVLTYDTTIGAGTTFESVVLVGLVEGVNTSVAGGLITLA
jgi:Ca2+-binding RTX toxin-like protein